MSDFSEHPLQGLAQEAEANSDWRPEGRSSIFYQNAISEVSPEATGEDVSEDGRPDWLPSNFRSPADLVKSYQEIQGAFTRATQERAALQKYVDSLTPGEQLGVEELPTTEGTFSPLTSRQSLSALTKFTRSTSLR